MDEVDKGSKALHWKQRRAAERRAQFAAELARLHDLQVRLEQASAEKRRLEGERNDLFCELHDLGLGATDMSEATKTEGNPEGVHSKHVQRIVTPPRSARRS